MKAAFSCGGTGGHIYPALAIAQKFPDNFFIGSNRLEKTLVPQAGHKFYEIAASPRQLFKILRGFYQSLRILAREKPDIVIATGGYVTVPVLLAARVLGQKIYLQEQNILPGRVNRCLSRLAARVFVAFAGAARYLPRHKTVVTGNPVRAEIAAVPYSAQSPGILVFGGSLAARSLNAAADGLRGTPYQAQLIHLNGQNYCHDMAGVYARSRLCVCRAGATTLSELAALGMPSILVPFPQAADNHQEVNARYFEQQGAAVVLLDKDLTAGTLAKAIAQIDRPEILAAMSRRARALGLPAAAEKIYDYITRTAGHQKYLRPARRYF
ncbi:MAG: UDP-N-acetylglucosamine--N-acetylmuramyl-(pentapeptide) pyrophosphoryl-undecaprenol N-acetylglucosamine transferase [Candidatus Margulisbacteria bacterium]|jgi:UDP-N-acetylglucosamine--N-acetylmuramyl-(pentapeptide) pyrophosphoryl-undecaprenol N-acetylglucosamine transferase|nr:UDP-N-acetylglucosamine--N-acetylmuramyl-(pentapeptide) pyrophosphoryl-undecaprenol N-acetylglucosamine transferase [Candidatus Margulisiibacteriota bacterium]